MNEQRRKSGPGPLPPRAAAAAECLRHIAAEYGEDTLLNRIRTIGIFADTAPELKEPLWLLECFYRADGAKTLFAARSGSPREQRAAFALAVRRLVTERFIMEAAARQICAAFWRAIGGSDDALCVAAGRGKADRAEELYQTALRYELGSSVAQNPGLAAQLFRKAAELGHRKAQRRLGRCYETGSGVPKLDGEAARWYLSAAAQGDAAAQFLAARCYERGIGTRKDPDEALKWYRLSAENGFAPAQSPAFFSREDRA